MVFRAGRRYTFVMNNDEADDLGALLHLPPETWKSLKDAAASPSGLTEWTFITTLDEHGKALICDWKLDVDDVMAMLTEQLGEVAAQVNLEAVADDPANEILESVESQLRAAGYSLLITASDGDSYDCFVVENRVEERVIALCEEIGVGVAKY